MTKAELLQDLEGIPDDAEIEILLNGYETSDFEVKRDDPNRPLLVPYA